MPAGAAVEQKWGTGVRGSRQRAQGPGTLSCYRTGVGWKGFSLKVGGQLRTSFLEPEIEEMARGTGGCQELSHRVQRKEDAVVHG